MINNKIKKVKKENKNNKIYENKNFQDTKHKKLKWKEIDKINNIFESKKKEDELLEILLLNDLI